MAQRRGRGEGSIFKRCKKCRVTVKGRKCERCDCKEVIYCAVLARGVHPDGKRKVYYGNTETEAVEKRQKAITDIHGGTYVEPSKLTLTQHLEDWMREHVRPNLKPNTAKAYDRAIHNQIVPHIGRKPLQQVQPIDLQRLYRELREAGLSNRMAELCHVILNAALKEAVIWGRVPKNVADAVKKPKADKYKPTPLTPEQAAALLDCAEQNPDAFAQWYLALEVGLRRGEMLGLRWSDINLDNSVIRIRYQVQAMKGEREKDTGYVVQWLVRNLALVPVKTQRSDRPIAISSEASTILHQHRKRQVERRVQAGDKWHPFDLLFCKRNGDPISPNSIYKPFHKLLAAAGIPHIRPHDLRHSSATILFNTGVQVHTIKDRLGHADLETTQHYAQVLQPTARRAAEDLAAVLRPKRKSGT